MTVSSGRATERVHIIRFCYRYSKLSLPLLSVMEQYGALVSLRRCFQMMGI